MRERYAAQVRLLVQLIPFVAEQKDFALKGGTAINLFYRNLPRYSVDIDLIYLPIQDRDASLKGIADGLSRIVEKINAGLESAEATLAVGRGIESTRILVRAPGATVKIEVSPVQRGTLFPSLPMMVHDGVEEEFGFAEIPVVAFEELFAGKIIAALDRAHPRDLFDVHHLLEVEGISDELFRTVLVYLISSRRPIHELLDPHPIDIADTFKEEFDSMTVEAISLQALYDARDRLIEELRRRLTGNAAAFLEAVHDCKADFGRIGLPQAAELPAVQWKLLNLERLKTDDPERHTLHREALRALFEADH